MIDEEEVDVADQLADLTERDLLVLVADKVTRMEKHQEETNGQVAALAATQLRHDGAMDAIRTMMTVGIGVATGAALAVNALVGEPQSLASRLATLATFAAVGAVEGAALAGLQWRVLRERLPRLRAWEWIGVTVALAVAGWILGMTPSLFINNDATVRGEPGLAAAERGLRRFLRRQDRSAPSLRRSACRCWRRDTARGCR